MRDRLLYVLDLNPAGAPVVHTMRASLKRDGSFAKLPKECCSRLWSGSNYARLHASAVMTPT